MPTWETLIDDAAQLCGGQNALARRLGASSGTLSSARSGRATLSREKLALLAELLHRDAAELWESQEVANLPRHNPFRRSVASALSALIAVILASVWPADSSAATTTYERISTLNTVYIVAHWRRLAKRCGQARRRIGRYLKASRFQCAAA